MTNEVLPPFGWIKFVTDNPSHKKPSAGSLKLNAGRMPTTLQRLKEISDINYHYNMRMKPKSDGPVDTWTLGATSGDCEDYALNKQAALFKLGWPSQVLRLAKVKTPSGEDHCVLIVRTSTGNFTLDNLTDKVFKFAETGYKLMSIQSENPNVWVSGLNNTFPKEYENGQHG